jgi:hypothetical protein
MGNRIRALSIGTGFRHAIELFLCTSSKRFDASLSKALNYSLFPNP